MQFCSGLFFFFFFWSSFKNPPRVRASNTARRVPLCASWGRPLAPTLPAPGRGKSAGPRALPGPPAPGRGDEGALGWRCQAEGTHPAAAPRGPPCKCRLFDSLIPTRGYFPPHWLLERKWGEGGRETASTGCLPHAPQLAPGMDTCSPGACPWPGIEPEALGSVRAEALTAEPHRPGLLFFKKNFFKEITRMISRVVLRARCTRREHFLLGHKLF